MNIWLFRMPEYVNFCNIYFDTLANNFFIGFCIKRNIKWRHYEYSKHFFNTATEYI